LNLIFELACSIFWFISIACNSSSNDLNTSDSVVKDSLNGFENLNSAESKSKETDCETEKNYIIKKLTEIQSKVKELQRSYQQLKYDEIEWGKFIRNWNINARDFREEKREDNFSCIHSLYFTESLIDLLQIGTSYAFDNQAKVNEFEKKLDLDVNSTLKEIRKNK
jgi:hypothetical protein